MEKVTAAQAAYRFAGTIRCACGAEMELQERWSVDEQNLDIYFKCPNCCKHTQMLTINGSAPVAEIMQRITAMKRKLEVYLENSTA